MLIIVICFLISLAGQSALCHFTKNSMLNNFLLVACPVGLLLACYLLISESFEYTIASLLVYSCACEFYIFLFSFVISSISVSLIINVFEGVTNTKELQIKYCGDLMLKNRLERMQEVGLLCAEGQMLMPSNKTHKMLKIFAILRAFFRHHELA